MSYKTIEQVIRDKAIQAVKQLAPSAPSATFNPNDIALKYIATEAEELKTKAEVYYKGMLVGWVELSVSFVATFKAKS
jgi:paraquat-inducible protein B